ncbi:NADPH:quinone reductase-like Zn-dependent oxidoreductase [Catenulispora sp. MAP5-51]
MKSPAMRAVRFDRYGGRDELYLAEVPIPATFPSGQGSDFAGVVVATGAEVLGRTFPLIDVRSAFEVLEAGHTHGKVVLIP